MTLAEGLRDLPTPLRHRLSLRRVAGLAAALLLAASLGCGPLEPQAPASPSSGHPETDLGKSGLGLPGNWLSTPRLFAAGPEIVALAATPGRLIASTRGPAPSKLLWITETGQMQPFAPGFLAPPDAVCPLEVAPGVGDFPQGGIYVGLANEVWLLAPDGSESALLATLPEPEAEIIGLSFDLAGQFGFDLVALARSGGVYRVDGSGRTLRVGSLGPGGSGPSVAGPEFGVFSGQLLVAFPGASELRAIDAGGTVRTVLLWSGVSGAYALPEAPRAFGSSGGGFFVATGAGQLYQFPLADIDARGGQVILTSIHRSGSGLVIPELSGYRTFPFSRSMGPEVAAAPVRRPVVMPITIEIMPGQNPKVLVLGTMDWVTVGVFASTGFTPSSLHGGEVRFAGAAPFSKSGVNIGTSTDLNGDGRLDLLVRFRTADMQLPLGDAQLTFEGAALTGDQVRGSGHLLVLAP